MKALLIPFLVIVSNIVLCFGAGQADNREYMKSLSFLNNLRSCSINNKYRDFNLPELSSYTTTGNSIVNIFVEKEYIMFWQKLEKQCYAINTQHLLQQSKGVALADFKATAYDPYMYNYNAEKKVLQPLFTGNLETAYLKCFNVSEENPLDCMYNVVKNCKAYGELDRVMIMCALIFLNNTVFIAMTSVHKFSKSDLDTLRTDDHALSFIREWDRNSSIAEILFLNFFLNARKIISHLTKTTKESIWIATLQTDLERIVQAEFPYKMIKEVRREKIANCKIIVGDAKNNQIHIINELRLWFVKQPKETIDSSMRIYLEDSILHLYVEEHAGEKFGDNLDSILKSLITEISEGNLNLEENPANLELV